MIDSVRISIPAREQLITLKRRTGLAHWNELGRWALCRSLAEPSSPPNVDIPVEGGLEIEWRTFAGTAADVYLDVLRQRCIRDGLDVESKTLQRQLRLHLHRGIGYLIGDTSQGRGSTVGMANRGLGVAALIKLGLVDRSLDAVGRR